jgi:hypothetical protein
MRRVERDENRVPLTLVLSPVGRGGSRENRKERITPFILEGEKT